MAAMALRRLAASLVVATLLAACAAHDSPETPAGCRADGRAPAATPRKPDPLGTARPIPGTGGPADAQVTEVLDPLPIGRAAPGCRLVGFGVILLARTSAVTVDLFSKMRLVTAGGDVYEPYPGQVEGRDGIDNTDLMPEDQRRGTEVFQVPARAKLRYFAIGTDDLITDASAPAGPLKIPAYIPGRWAKLGTTQTADRLAGERLAVTPLSVMDPTPATAGVAAGRRAYSVRLRLKSTGTKAWPVNPENMVVFIDDGGRQWIPGFVTTTAAPPFDPLRGEPGREQTAWVTAEIPGDARIVAMCLSPYPGIVDAWRL